MQTTVLVVLVVVLVVAVLAMWFFSQRRKSQQLQERFGPEYEHAVHEHGSRGHRTVPSHPAVRAMISGKCWERIS